MTKKLLIVDDNVACVDLYRTRFEMDHYEVMVVYSAEAAIEKLKTYRPDAILLDLMLPKMQGDELLTILKSDPKTKDIKIIVLTALNMTDEKEHEVCSQSDDCIYKIDIMPKELVERVSELILGKK